MPAKNLAICPVFWTHHLVKTIPALPHEPLFLLPTKDRLTLSANQLVYRLRKWLQLINLNSTQYSLHSLRRGGVTFAYHSNLEAEMIKVLGDWSSEAYRRYVDISMDQRYESMVKFVEALDKLTVEAYM